MGMEAQACSSSQALVRRWRPFSAAKEGAVRCIGGNAQKVGVLHTTCLVLMVLFVHRAVRGTQRAVVSLAGAVLWVWLGTQPTASAAAHLSPACCLLAGGGISLGRAG